MHFEKTEGNKKNTWNTRKARYSTLILRPNAQDTKDEQWRPDGKGGRADEKKNEISLKV